MNKVFKILFFILLLLLSPLVVLALLGTVYVAARVLAGLELSAAIGSLRAVIQKLMPYFLYLTILPIVLLTPALLMKNKSKLKTSRK